MFWSAIERFSSQGVHFLMTIVISRFVLPEEFGLVAMLGIFIAVSNSIIDCGFTTALIQKQDRTMVDYSTAFYSNLIIGIILYSILYFCSPLIASFYSESRLDIVTKVICISLVIRSLSVVQIARFNINLDFKAISKASLTASVVSGCIGLVMAVLGYGVWAIVVQTVVGAGISTILLWGYSDWRPVWRFSITSFKKLFAFGSKLMVSGLMHTIYLNLYTLVIGKYYCASDVGYFNRANTLAQYPSTNIVSIINRVYFPLLCKQQDDKDVFQKTFHSYLRIACFIVFPLAFGMAAVAEPLLRLILTSTWDGAIIPMQIIAMAYLFYPILLINNQPLQALNHTTMFFYAEIIKKIIALVLLSSAVHYGLIILCLSVLVYNMCDTIIILFFTRTIMQTGFKKQAFELYRHFIASLLMGIAVYLFVRFSPFGNLITTLIGILLSIFIYGSSCKVLRIKEFDLTINILKKYVKSNDSYSCL